MREWQACKVLLDNSGLGRWYASVILYYICGDFVKAVHNGKQTDRNDVLRLYSCTRNRPRSVL